MNSKVRKILEILFVIIVIGISIAIFINRKKIENVSSVSYLGVFFSVLSG